MHRSLLMAVLATIVALLTPAEASAAPKVERGVDYDLDGSRPAPAQLGTLDLHLPAGTRPHDRRGVVVYAHGGGWRRGDKAAVGAKARLFTDAGYVFASVNYRLSPSPPNPGDAGRVRFPDHPRDVAEAVAWLHRNAHRHGGNGRRMVLTGHSAGAHLVALVATDRRYLQRFRTPARIVRGFVPLDAGGYDVAEAARVPGRRGAIFRNAFGTPAEERADARWAQASMSTHADPGDPPALVVTQRRRMPAAHGYAARLGGFPDAAVLALDKTHLQINVELGTPAGAASGETRAVMGFVDRVLRRSGPPGGR